MMRAARARAGVATLAVMVLCACAERPQTAQAPLKKLDTPASQGADDAFVTPGWTAGNEASWEAQLRKRAQGQNEYARIAAGS